MWDLSKTVNVEDTQTDLGWLKQLDGSGRWVLSPCNETTHHRNQHDLDLTALSRRSVYVALVSVDLGHVMLKNYSLSIPKVNWQSLSQLCQKFVDYATVPHFLGFWLEVSTLHFWNVTTLLFHFCSPLAWYKDYFVDKWSLIITENIIENILCQSMNNIQKYGYLYVDFL